LDDYESDHCPVCHEKIGRISIDDRIKMSVHEHYKDQIWKPGDPIPEESTEISPKRKEIMEALREVGQG
jgi:hypothetical protein